MTGRIAQRAASLLLRARSTLNSLAAPSRRPPRRIPDELAAGFTMNGRVPVMDLYLNDIRRRPLRWTTRSRWWSYDDVARKRCRYYQDTDAFLYSALDDFDIRNKRVVVIGSETPWYECICSYYGGTVTTIEHRSVDCQIPGLTVLSPDELPEHPRQFDVAVSISSVEHHGLGRYGEPIDPDGDLKAMQRIRRLVAPDGLLFLAVPLGSDAVVWNAHRIYGRRRLPELTKGWEALKSYGFQEDLFDREPGVWDRQPVLVLRPVR